MSRQPPFRIPLAAIGGLVAPFIDLDDQRTLAALGPNWIALSHYGTVPFPASPRFGLQRRRSRGFGQPDVRRSASHDTVPVPWLFHMAWPWLQPADRHRLETLLGHTWRSYAALRTRTAFTSLSVLRLPRDHPVLAAFSLRERSIRLGMLEILFNFEHGDVVRYMQGEYTNSHRNFQEVYDAIECVKTKATPTDYPRIQFDQAFRIHTEGAPLAGTFCCNARDVRARIQYDNHEAIQPHREAIRAKFVEEEGQSYHIMLPRFLAIFFYGLFISPITWAIRKGKGRLCVDSSSRLHALDSGAPNVPIPKPGVEGREDECPAIYYATAFQRHISHIWNLRISHPTTDILQYCDDIKSAFRRVLYHPDLAIVFSYVFEEFLIIPVGFIFGGRSSPSFWCTLAELRAHLASVSRDCGLFRDMPAVSDLVAQISLPAPLTEDEIAELTPAVADDLNPGVQAPFLTRSHHSTFVDDNGSVALRDAIADTIYDSIASAFHLFGLPDSDRRGPCFALDKWLKYASPLLIYLGFEIDTRCLTVTWPLEKRTDLATRIDTLLAGWIERGLVSTISCEPRFVAAILGLIRNAAQVAPLVVYLSMRCQFWFNSLLSRSSHLTQRRSWWKRNHLRVPQFVLHDLLALSSLVSDNASDTIWQRYIGYLVPRDFTAEALQDAAHEGLGGWSPSYHFMWRVHRSTLISSGFNMEDLGPLALRAIPDGASEDQLHINILEFVALIINVWFCLWHVRRFEADRVGGHILNVRGDNTSALSWMRFSTRSRNPVVRRLSRFLVLLLTKSAFPGRLDGSHIKGVLNDEADCLSRPLSRAPSWASVTTQCSRLRSCRPLQVPSIVLSVLSKLLSQNATEVVSEQEMTRLLTVEPATLVIG